MTLTLCSCPRSENSVGRQNVRRSLGRIAECDCANGCGGFRVLRLRGGHRRLPGGFPSGDLVASASLHLRRSCAVSTHCRASPHAAGAQPRLTPFASLSWTLARAPIFANCRSIRFLFMVVSSSRTWVRGLRVERQKPGAGSLSQRFLSADSAFAATESA
jgi:hypothetical protein